jgi:hypothetical protein
VPLHGDRIIPSPCVITIFGSLKKNIQKTEKVTQIKPRATQAMETGGSGINLDMAANKTPAARDGKIKGYPSLSTRI